MCKDSACRLYYGSYDDDGIIVCNCVNVRDNTFLNSSSL